MKRIINFSGGRTSALMTIQNYREGDIVLFTDTLREHEGTYKFIDEFEKNEGIPVTRISYGNGGGFTEMLEKKGFRQIPNRVKRICTVELKIRTAKRYIRKMYGKQDYEWLVGFRADEERRVKSYNPGVKYIKPMFPLYDNGTTKEMVIDYWKNKSYDLSIPAILGNCSLCFLKGKNVIISIMRDYPELAKEWIRDEEMSAKSGRNRTYFQDITYRELFNISQSDLFKQQDLSDLSPAYDCSCTN
jgi:hypothetical protein